MQVFPEANIACPPYPRQPVPTKLFVDAMQVFAYLSPGRVGGATAWHHRIGAIARELTLQLAQACVNS